MLKGKLIINAAITGLVPTKELTPHVPITPGEIARDAKKVCELGASILHIHARDDMGGHCTDKERYAEIISRVRDVCGDVIITVSTSGRNSMDITKRAEVLSLEGDCRPDMASLTMGSMNFMDGTSLNSPETINFLLETMQSNGISPELEIFGSGMANYSKYMVKKGLISANSYANIIMGSLGAIPASPKHLLGVLDDIPETFTWAATGVGRFAFKTQCLAIVMGGNVRVGLEDSIYMDAEKKELATNESLVRRVLDVAGAVGREPATPAEVRAMLGL